MMSIQPEIRKVQNPNLTYKQQLLHSLFLDDLQKQMLNACEKGEIETVRTLLSSDPSLITTTDKDKYTPLHRACYENQTEVVKLLLENGADVGAVTEMGWQPLHSCCPWNNKESAVLLIQNGADVNAKSEGGQTPLHIAAGHAASLPLVQLLLMHPYIKADLVNNNGETAWDIAKRSSKYYNVFDAVDPLLDYTNLK